MSVSAMMIDQSYEEDLTLLRLKVDERARLFIRQEVRDLLFLHPKSEVFVEKTRSGQLKLKIQRKGMVVKVWLLSDGPAGAENNRLAFGT